ncbi:hypothetical protein ScPMuIL_009459 [Solemya velum]
MEHGEIDELLANFRDPEQLITWASLWGIVDDPVIQLRLIELRCQQILDNETNTSIIDDHEATYKVVRVRRPTPGPSRSGWCGPLMPVSTIALNGVTGHFSRRDLLFALYIMVYVHPSVNDQTVDLNLTEKKSQWCNMDYREQRTVLCFYGDLPLQHA